jgi:hypothetical protein
MEFEGEGLADSVGDQKTLLDDSNFIAAEVR